MHACAYPVFTCVLGRWESEERFIVGCTSSTQDVRKRGQAKERERPMEER